MYRVLALIPILIFATSCSGKKGGKAPQQEAPSETPIDATPTPTPTPVSALPAVVISSPSSMPVVSNASSLMIAGTCQSGATVAVTGDALASAPCSAGSFSLSVSKSLDGNWSFSVVQSTSGADASSPVTVTWNRDATAPIAPVITAPGTNPLTSNGSSVTLSGSCETGAVVILGGAGSASQTCVGAAFSFNLSQSSDGNYSYTLMQKDAANNSSSTASFQWNRDTTAPTAPTVTAPSVNPYISSDTNITISGACENGATVNLGGAGTDSMVCASNAYSFPVTKSTDGVYNFSLSQKDAANNTSATTAFQWVRDTGVPATPVITTPAVASVTTNANSQVIAGTCTTGYTVELSGAATNSQVCASNVFSFTVTSSSDGSKAYSVLQKSPANNSSASASVTWIRDTVAPAALALTNPASSPFISSSSTLSIDGSCENGAVVYLTGDAAANTACASGSFTFTVTKSTDGNYNFSLLQKDAATNSSTSTTLNWIRDTTSPAAPTLVSPTSPYLSNTNSVTITGGCESQATVQLTGDASTSAVCTLNNYSLTVTKSSDGNFNFTIAQTDLAGNSSTSISFNWQRDTQAPTAVTIVNPASNPYTSSGSSVTLSGACENGAVVSLTGAATSSMTCASNAYSFALTKSVDGTYNYSLAQTDPAGNASASTAFTWVRDSAVPSTPTITTPSVSIYNSNTSSLTISGACTTGNTVELSGASTNSMTCASSAYSFSVNNSTDGTYSYSVKQKSGSGVYSAAATVQWIRDTVVPSAPTITSPNASPKYSNGNSITVSGACENGATVKLAGAATNTTACSSGSYSFTVNNSVDGNYSYNVSQTDPAGNVSASSSVTWVRDTLAPAVPGLISPASNPFASGDTNINLTASCEPNASVTMTGDATGTATCSALGQFTLSISKSVDGTYNVSVTQKDLANNTSASLDFQWIRDTSVPSTPVIAAPASNPFRSNQNTITIQATCDDSLSPTAAVVNLSGDVSAGEVTSPAGSLSQNCTSSPVTFVIQKTADGTYNFSVDQENPNNGTSSATADIQWIRDTVVPAAPTITSPSTNPFTAPGNLTLSGACDPNATVYLTGADTQNVTCSLAGSYSFSVTKSTDATYNFILSQTDLAGNTSSNRNFQWIRDSNSVPPPTITSPAASPSITKLNSIVISGNCNDGYALTLAGDVTASDVTTPANSLTQTCAGGAFSYEIAKSSDGTFNFQLTQTFNSVTSSAATMQWKRDTVAPTVSISANPSNPNLSTGGAFTFSSNESGSTLECKLDTGSFASCTSPLTYATITNGSRTFSVRATDSAGNVSTTQTYSWVQAAYNAVALYHLDTASPLTDSSLYTQNAIVNQTLSSTGTTTNDTSGKFNNSRGFGSSIYLSTASTNVLNNAASTATIEGFVKMSSSISTTGQYYTLLSKTAASPQLGWEIRLRKASSTKYAIDFVSSLNGTTTATVSTSTFTASTSTWYYFAVTWNKGQTKIYFNSTTAKVSSGSVGTSTLFASSGALAVGKGSATGTGSSLWFAGSLDEVRISQTIRTIAIPTAAFTAD